VGQTVYHKVGVRFRYYLGRGGGASMRSGGLGGSWRDDRKALLRKGNEEMKSENKRKRITQPQRRFGPDRV